MSDSRSAGFRDQHEGESRSVFGGRGVDLGGFGDGMELSAVVRRRNVAGISSQMGRG